MLNNVLINLSIFRWKLSQAAFIFIQLVFIGCNQDKPAKRANVILILADDFGIMDSQGYAQHFTGVSKDSMFYETPNIDRLINEGIAFDQAYANQLCSPTRASILTGKYAAKLGFTTATPPTETYYNQNLPVPEGHYIHDAIYHSDNIDMQMAWLNGSTNTALPAGTELDDGWDETTIAEAMTEHHSAFIGKWHIGGHGAKGYTPSDQGFETISWLDSGSSPFFNWRNAWNNNQIRRFPKIPQDSMFRGSSGDDFGQQYLTDELTAQALKFINKRSGIEEEPFFLYLCHFAVHAPFQAKSKDIKNFEGKDTKGWNNQDHATYAAMIKSLDESVGRILDRLTETGLDENTLVVFMSDNGGIDKKVTPNGIVTDNSPFTGGKANVTEGGVRVPLIFRWKGVIDEGKWCHVPVDCNDIFPTILTLAGYNTEKFNNGENAIDGQSVHGLFADPENSNKTYTRERRFWHYPFNVKYNDPFTGFPLTPHSAMRDGAYKLIFDWHGRLYLFNIEEDRSEKHDLSNALPMKTREMFSILIRWLEQNVDERYWPQRNHAYDPEKDLRPYEFRNLLSRVEYDE